MREKSECEPRINDRGTLIKTKTFTNLISLLLCKNEKSYVG